MKNEEKGKALISVFGVKTDFEWLCTNLEGLLKTTTNILLYMEGGQERIGLRIN